MEPSSTANEEPNQETGDKTLDPSLNSPDRTADAKNGDQEENPTASSSGSLVVQTPPRNQPQQQQQQQQTLQKTTRADEEMKETNMEETKDGLDKGAQQVEEKGNTEGNPNDDNNKSWDHTDRKVVIHNMFKFLDNRKGKKLAEQWAKDATATIQASSTTTLPIAIHKVRKPPSDTFMVVTLMNSNMVTPFIEYINNNKHVTNKRGVKLFAKRAVARDNGDDGEEEGGRRRNRKRKCPGDGGDDEEEDMDTDDRDVLGQRLPTSKRGLKRQNRDQIMQESRRPITVDEIRERITPLFRLTTQEQATHKQRDMVRNCAMKMVAEIKGRFRTLERDGNRRAKNQRQQQGNGGGKRDAMYQWLTRKRGINVDMVRSVPSPLRNKVEFTFGYRYAYEGEEQEEIFTATESNLMNEESNAADDSENQPRMVKDSEMEDSNNIETNGTNSTSKLGATGETVHDASAETTPTTEGAATTTADEGTSSTMPTNSVVPKEATKSSDGDEQMATANATGSYTMTETLVSEPGSESNDKESAATGPTSAPSTTPKSEEINSDNNKKVIQKISSLGFMAAGWAGGVSKPHACANIPFEMCALVDLMEDFLKQSPLPPYDPKGHQGFWRYLTVRTSRRTRQCMVILVHVPVTGGVGDEGRQVKRLIEKLQAAQLPIKSETRKDDDKCNKEDNDNGNDFNEGSIPITSLYFQEFGGVSNPPPDHPVQHVFGKTVLEEKLGKCTFQISPGAFFQVNTAGAELLYQIVMDKLSEFIQKRWPNEETVVDDEQHPKRKKKIVLFDVCCGTGTIGLACLKGGVVDQVIGIDISDPAIQDAKRNAELNGFGKDDSSDESLTRFVASRAEYVMAKEIGRALKNRNKSNRSASTNIGSSNNSKTDEPDSDCEYAFLAVVDPAREGLHSDVVKALRQTEQIERIVYVSCNPTGSLVKDAGLLCAPPTKRYCGRAFRPTSASPVDMFPLTSHCEMVMTFDRVQDADM